MFLAISYFHCAIIESYSRVGMSFTISVKHVMSYVFFLFNIKIEKQFQLKIPFYCSFQNFHKFFQ